MGSLEHSVRKEIRKTKIQSAIVGTIAVAGVLAVAAIAPNVLGALGKLGLIKPYQKRQRIKTSLHRLIERGYVHLEGVGQNRKVRLTPKGERFAALLGAGRLAPKKPKRWDKKWRVLVFDIPERRRKTRDQIRITLVNLGFCRLQDSVWVYPYDCEDLITLLKADLRIGKALVYMIVDQIQYDVSLRNHFGLPVYK